MTAIKTMRAALVAALESPELSYHRRIAGGR